MFLFQLIREKNWKFLKKEALIYYNWSLTINFLN